MLTFELGNEFNFEYKGEKVVVKYNFHTPATYRKLKEYKFDLKEIEFHD